MANIFLDNLVKRFGKQTAVKNLTLEVKDKEFVAILGPSGCGKTTTMNMISGLLKPDSGRVYFDGRDVTDVPPGKRGVGFVFQNYAVFTHMSVYDNIAFGLRIKKFPTEEIEREVRGVAELLKITHLLGVSASKLSINDMQKVALARSMVTKPKIFLLDEPLSNLDAALRNIMRAELKKIQQELGQTTIYVTHDQIEAMSLADRIAVMNFAVLQQYATPHEVYNKPVNLFVARFIGSPTINFFDALYESGRINMIDFKEGKIELSERYRNQLNSLLKNNELVVGLRPEHLKVSGKKKNYNLKGQVVSYEPLGSKTIIYMHPDNNQGLIIKSAMESDFKPEIGDKLYLDFKESDLYVFDRKSTELVLKF